MARKVVVVCDVCGSDNSITSWEIRSLDTGRKKKAEVCNKHSELLSTLLGEDAPEAPRRRGRQNANRVVSPQEIEAQRASQGAQ